MFYTTFADPFNTIKFVTLTISSSWLAGNFFQRRIYPGRTRILYIFFLTIFVGTCFLSTIFSDYFYTSFIGENLRKNGLLTYFSLAIFSAYFALYFSYDKLKQFFKWISVTNLLCIMYGFLQIFDLDPISWSGSAGIFSFYGNSNFAGTAYSIFFFLSVANFYFEKSFTRRKLILFLIISNLICVYFTNARQSLLSIGFCLVILIGFLLNNWKKKALYLYISLILPITLVSIFGIFNFGPFSQFLYKDSIRVRIFYWKAAFGMFKDHPLVGVGLDRYGAYFKEYRDSLYPLSYGWDLTSTNAHNVPLQFFSTSGLFSGVFYCVIVFFIFLLLLRRFSSISKEKKPIVFSLFLTWACYQFQSLFTVDNIAISIWNWVLMGILVGLLTEKDNIDKFPKFKNNINLLSGLVAATLTIPSIFLGFNLNKAESQVFKLMSTFSPNNPSNEASFTELAQDTLNIPFIDPTYQTLIGGYLIDYKKDELGKNVIEKVLKNDVRNLQVLNALSIYYENRQEFLKALEYRYLIEKFDKWNAKNYLNIINDNMILGNIEQAKFYANKIREFASVTDVGKTLKSTFPDL